MEKTTITPTGVHHKSASGERSFDSFKGLSVKTEPVSGEHSCEPLEEPVPVKTESLKRPRALDTDEPEGPAKKRHEATAPEFFIPGTTDEAAKFLEKCTSNSKAHIVEEQKKFAAKVSNEISDAARNGNTRVVITAEVYWPKGCNDRDANISPHCDVRYRQKVLQALEPLGWTVSKPSRHDFTKAKWILTVTSERFPSTAKD